MIKMYEEEGIQYCFQPQEGYTKFTYKWTYKGKPGLSDIYCKNKDQFNQLLKFWSKTPNWEFVVEK